MADHRADHTQGVPSTAAIADHPIHPILIPFPIAFLVGALATDLGYWWTADPFWARVSLWLVGAGLVTGALAAVFGLIDFLTISRAREHLDGRIRFLGNTVALVLALVSLLLRSRPIRASGTSTPRCTCGPLAIRAASLPTSLRRSPALPLAHRRPSQRSAALVRSR